MSERFVAVLKWMGGDNGYGFTVEQDGKEVFVHYDPIQGEGYRVLLEGEKCGFEIKNGRKGLTASNLYQPSATPHQRYERP